MIKEQHKQWIDNATYTEMLYRWRFSELGDPMFQGQTGDYFARVMQEKRNQLKAGEQVNASKTVGWEK